MGKCLGWKRIDAGKEEEVNGCEDCTDRKVNVKTLAHH